MRDALVCIHQFWEGNILISFSPNRKNPNTQNLLISPNPSKHYPKFHPNGVLLDPTAAGGGDRRSKLGGAAARRDGDDSEEGRGDGPTPERAEGVHGMAKRLQRPRHVEVDPDERLFW